MVLVASDQTFGGLLVAQPSALRAFGYTPKYPSGHMTHFNQSQALLQNTGGCYLEVFFLTFNGI